MMRWRSVLAPSGGRSRPILTWWNACAPTTNAPLRRPAGWPACCAKPARPFLTCSTATRLGTWFHPATETSWRACSGSDSGLPERSARVYTIGHSTRTLEAFADLLQLAGVRRLIDVRTVPRSRTNPQYNRDALPGSLEGYAIEYRHVAAFGGLRPQCAAVECSVNGWLQHSSIHNYADHALVREFGLELEQLTAAGRKRACAIMTANAVWWRCFRRLVSHYFLEAGIPVSHPMGKDR